MALTILFAPLIGALFAGFLNNIVNEKVAMYVSTGLVGLSAILSWMVFFTFDTTSVDFIEIFQWIRSGDLITSWSIRLDSLTVVMLVVVTSVSFVVHFYSFGYMDHDHNWKVNEKYKARFFSYLSFFTFTMLVLVTSNNFLQLFFGWEGVGLASYLLIGFYYKKPSANAAAMKAFIVNRIGDFGFALGIFIIFLSTGSLLFDDLFSLAPSLSEASISFMGLNLKSAELIAFLLFIGAMGKSAQLLLHTWLPDAMEGPTPVSALIHAATMVTAGVFLVCRMSPLIEYAPVASAFIAIIGASTAFFAATIGLVQNDIKRVIAYSTCSQLGYMFAAAGVGFYQAAMFHLFTHAFFKALLFLGAGSVIHAMHHQQDLRHYGGLYKKLPYTFIAMLIGTLAITGVGIPFSYEIFHNPIGLAGFISKDAIIEGVFASNTDVGAFSFWMLVIAAMMTSFYSWRLMFLTFFGDFRGEIKIFESVKESNFSMIVPLLLLCVGAIFAGMVFYGTFLGEKSGDFFQNGIFLASDNNLLSDFHYVHPFVKVMPFLAMLLGLFLAFQFYIKDPSLPRRLARQHLGLYKFLYNKWYFDELFNYLFVRSVLYFGNIFWKLGDGLIIDGFINKIALGFIPKLTALYGKIQSGFLFHYAFGIIIGLTAILTWILISWLGI